MHSLTSDGRRYQLRVDLRAANGTQYYEIYDDFNIGPSRDFTLHVGNHRGTAGGCKRDMLKQKLPITVNVGTQLLAYMKTYIKGANSSENDSQSASIVNLADDLKHTSEVGQ